MADVVRNVCLASSAGILVTKTTTVQLHCAQRPSAATLHTVLKYAWCGFDTFRLPDTLLVLQQSLRSDWLKAPDLRLALCHKAKPEAFGYSKVHRSMYDTTLQQGLSF